ncbi:hypothetical protein [Stieleria varia]|uniref:Uncharacterized protein n=1 Tax=Stieleria varia TaxID=2528005 RepID=A0A5C6ANI2_9BACT|nr:hypothetical protein [Stieleria varia]TWU00809.1 hypothetical protein Pla52n_41780 [Stieleria varia]
MTTRFLLQLASACILVVGLTIVFRLPSCSESFWIDELHSAWTVADGLGDVAPRARIGNQTPLYFQALWLWRALVGDGELPMRMSSVLLSAFAAGCLVIGVAVTTRRISAGVIAGGILVVERNAMFFGCELRPYAAVMCCAVLAAWSAVAALDSRQRSDRWRLALIGSVCLAALLHPTSLGVLGWLVPITWIVIWRRGQCVFTRWDGVAVVVIVITVWMLWRSSLPQSWSHREQWKSFAHATSWSQLWDERRAWAWLPLAILPIGLAVVWSVVRRVRQEKHTDVLSGWLPGLVGVVGTVAFFVASYLDIVPLWHRRYFIAALPLLAWSAGVAGTWGLPCKRLGSFLAVGSAVIVLCVLMWHQGTLGHLWHTGRVPRELRGEPWREAVALVQAERKAGEPVWLDTGLIEASFLSEPMSDADDLPTEFWRYLAFPVSGPYRLEDVTVVSVTEHESWRRQRWNEAFREGHAVWLISRQHPDAVSRYCERARSVIHADIRMRRLGQLSVVRLSMPD